MAAATESSVMAVIRASRPSFRNAHDKLAFAVHAAFVASNHALIAAGTNALSDPSSYVVDDEVGIEGWNEFDDTYAFVYVKMGNTKNKVFVKCLTFEGLLMVDAVNMGVDEKEPCHLKLSVKDYISDGKEKTGNYGELYKNFSSLVANLNSEILAKLGPQPAKSGSSSSTSRDRETTEDISPSFVGVPEDHPNYGSGFAPPLVPPMYSDLEPGPTAGVYPSRGIGSGSMLVGPNDPRWSDLRVDHPRGFGETPPGLPQGARFDPYGPPGVPGFEPSRFVRQPRRPGPGIHPDLQHFQSDFI